MKERAIYIRPQGNEWIAYKIGYGTNLFTMPSQSEILSATKSWAQSHNHHTIIIDALDGSRDIINL